MAADPDTPPRALVVGSAGSGKSGTLRQLRAALSDRGVEVVLAQPGADLDDIPADDIVLVDDAHLIDEHGLEALSRRVDDPAAGIVVACRPWPQSDAFRVLARRLEASSPAIVLGHVTAADAAAHHTGAALPPACIDSLLEMCGGATWLVSEALALHGDDGCRGEADHDAIATELQEVIAHRVQTLDSGLREAIEVLCLAPAGRVPAAITDDMVAAGHAEGLLQRNGQPAPVVRAAVRATVPVQRVVQLFAADDLDDADRAGLLGDLRDPRIAAALLKSADATLLTDPQRAAELYERAEQCGADTALVALGRARAAWAQGRIDAASAALDGLLAHDDPALREQAATIAAAVWAARGVLTESDATYHAVPSVDPVYEAHAAVAALAVADRDRVMSLREDAPARTMPSTLTVSMDLLARGMRATLTGPASAALNDLVRASQMYTASASDGAIPEVPAVIAALAAINVGELDVANSVLDDALTRRHAGAWAHDRLRLWSAWVALQRERPHDAQAALHAASSELNPREKLLADALVVALARRYGDLAELTSTWRETRARLLGAQFDLFSVLPLCEFVVTGARVGEPDWMQPHFAAALEQVQRLGSPPFWTAHLHWTGIQAGILNNRSADLRPHARELVAAAPHNRLAAMMAQAGRVWTAVLTKSVDVDAVEQAAFGLATVGLAWDGARLAGQAAARTDDRRSISRLLSCARQLHPRENARPASVDDAGPVSAPAPRADAALSIREREVAVLVLQGKTYAEIGNSIFISPRTAEHHIARIRRRLGATTRSDLIGKLRRILDAEPEESAAVRESTSPDSFAPPAPEIPIRAREHPLPG